MELNGPQYDGAAVTGSSWIDFSGGVNPNDTYYIEEFGMPGGGGRG